jgi:hypothetical protein
MQTVTQKFYKEHRWSKKINDLQKQEKIYSTVKDYDNAEGVRILREDMEKRELDSMQGDL